MDRILGLSLVGAGPGNVFGPGMSAGALESFARGGRGKADGGDRGAAGGARSAAGSGGKSAAERTSEAGGKGVNGQQGRGADADADAKANAGFRFHPALDGIFCFEAVAPH